MRNWKGIGSLTILIREGYQPLPVMASGSADHVAQTFFFSHDKFHPSPPKNSGNFGAAAVSVPFALCDPGHEAKLEGDVLR